MKSFIKSLVISVGGAFAPLFWPKNPSLLILAYHRVLPRDHKDMVLVQPGMVVYPETFEMHINVLQRYFEFVYLDDWLRDAKANKPLPKRACAITFDDGWHDNYEYALPVLAKMKVPSTIFLVTDMIGTARRFWPDRIARLIWNDGKGRPPSFYDRHELKWLKDLVGSKYEVLSVPSRELIDEVIMSAKKYGDQEIEKYLSVVESENPGADGVKVPDILSWDELREMANLGVRFGSHTRNHLRVSATKNVEILKSEIQGSKKLLESKYIGDINLFCFPNGDLSDQAINIVRDQYVGACTTIKGWNNVDSDHLLLRRVMLHQDVGATPHALLYRISYFIKNDEIQTY